MTSHSTSTILNPTSPFLKFCTQITNGTIMGLLRLVAHTYNLTSREAVCVYFDRTNDAEKTIGFKQLVNKYFQDCCDEYINTQQEIIDGKKTII